MSLVATAIGILRGTPWWAFLLAAVLVWLGLRALRPRVTTVVRVLMTPAVFITWGLASLSMGGRPSSAVALVWLVTAMAGVAVAMLTVRVRLVVDRVHRLVLVPASMVPLVRNVVVFSAKYALAVAAIIHPEARGQTMVWDVAVSGASAGYFFGWVVRFALAYRDALTADLTATAHRGRLTEAAPGITVGELTMKAGD
jgi:hypothetical protein